MAKAVQEMLDGLWGGGRVELELGLGVGVTVAVEEVLTGCAGQAQGRLGLWVLNPHSHPHTSDCYRSAHRESGRRLRTYLATILMERWPRSNSLAMSLYVSMALRRIAVSLLASRMRSSARRPMPHSDRCPSHACATWGWG